MDLYYKQELRVGGLVMLAAAVFTVGLLWLSGRSIGASRTVIVPVRFENVAGLRPGDPVQTSGVRVGRVTNVELKGARDVMVYLEVDPSARPHVDAQALVASKDFLGAKFVDYVPGSSKEMLREGQVITGTRVPDVTEAASELSGRAADALKGVQTLLSQQTADDIHNMLASLDRTLKVIAKVGEGPMVADTRETMEAVRKLATTLDSTLARPDIRKSLDQLDETTESLRETSEGLSTMTNSLGSILAKVDSGQGVIGKMVNDSTLAKDMHDLLVSMRKLLDDVRERPGRYINVKVF